MQEQFVEINLNMLTQLPVNIKIDKTVLSNIFPWTEFHDEF